jgi:hypothetical protein
MGRLNLEWREGIAESGRERRPVEGRQGAGSWLRRDRFWGFEGS